MSSALMSGAPETSDSEWGTFEFDLDEILRGNTKLDALQEAFAIEYLRRSKQVQLERLQCIADGALLAAEQVQDVRLKLLEQGPEISTGAALFDLFVGFILDSSIAGSVIKAFVGGVAKRMVARNTLLLSGERAKAKSFLESLRRTRNGNGTWSGSAALLAKIDKEKLRTARLSATEYLKAANGWRAVIANGPSDNFKKNVTAVAKTAQKGVPKKYFTKPLKINGDTPGVSLVGSVQEFVSIARVVITLQYERMETLIRIGSMTGKDARQFLELAEFEPSPESLEYIRDRCKLLFEAIVWAGLHNFDNRDLWGRLSARDGLKDIDERLVNYWLMRFGAEVKRWNNELGPQGRFNMGLMEIAEWQKLKKFTKEAEVGRYFTQVLKELPQKLSDANALISDFHLATYK